MINKSMMIFLNFNTSKKFLLTRLKTSEQSEVFFDLAYVNLFKFNFKDFK